MRRSILAAVAAMLLPACGGGGGGQPPTTMPPPTTLPPCTEALVFEGSGPVPSFFLVTQSFSTTTTGRLDVILDWTFAASTIGVYVVQGPCSLDQFNARTCNFVIRSEGGPKPRRVSASASAGAYTLLVGNFSTQDESVSTQIFVRSTSCPPLASVPAASEASVAGTSRELRAVLRR